VALSPCQLEDPTTALSPVDENLAAATGPDGKIYAIGGSNVNYFLSTVEAYTPGTNSWTAVAPMPTARYALAAATGRDGRIYAIGGSNGSGFLATVEAYTPGTNSWAAVAPMPTARNFLAAATGRDGKINAIGGRGYNGRTFEYLSTVEAYTPGTNSRTAVAPMSTARSALAAATGRDGRIYAIGGSNGNYLSTVEAYDTGVLPPSGVPEFPWVGLAPLLGVVGVKGTVAVRRRRARSAQPGWQTFLHRASMTQPGWNARMQCPCS
jgi:N-acetylneuraminic acid mutarotase